MERPIRIVLADDHPVVRIGVRNMLVASDGFDVVGEASDGEAEPEGDEQHGPRHGHREVVEVLPHLAWEPVRQDFRAAELHPPRPGCASPGRAWVGIAGGVHGWIMRDCGEMSEQGRRYLKRDGQWRRAPTASASQSSPSPGSVA